MLGSIDYLNNVKNHKVEDRENKSKGGFPATIPCYACKFAISPSPSFIFIIYFCRLLNFMYLVNFLYAKAECKVSFFMIQIPQSGWDKLFISFIPSDSGKATSKTTKANVRNGTCKWADPIYETTRLLQDIKTRQYDEKLYKLLVGMVMFFMTVISQLYSVVPYIELADSALDTI